MFCTCYDLVTHIDGAAANALACPWIHLRNRSEAKCLIVSMISRLHEHAAKSIHSLLNILLDSEPIGSPLSVFVDFFCPKNAMVTVRIGYDLTNFFGLGSINEVNLD